MGTPGAGWVLDLGTIDVAARAVSGRGAGRPRPAPGAARGSDGGDGRGTGPATRRARRGRQLLGAGGARGQEPGPGREVPTAAVLGAEANRIWHRVPLGVAASRAHPASRWSRSPTSPIGSPAPAWTRPRRPSARTTCGRANGRATLFPHRLPDYRGWLRDLEPAAADPGPDVARTRCRARAPRMSRRTRRTPIAPGGPLPHPCRAPLLSGAGAPNIAAGAPASSPIAGRSPLPRPRGARRSGPLRGADRA